MKILQTTRFYTPAELQNGITLDFISRSKKIIGVAVNTENEQIGATDNISLYVEAEEYIPQGTPLFLFFSIGNYINPNAKFFTLLGQKICEGKKFTIRGEVSFDTQFILLLQE